MQTRVKLEVDQSCCFRCTAWCALVFSSNTYVLQISDAWKTVPLSWPLLDLLLWCLTPHRSWLRFCHGFGSVCINKPDMHRIVCCEAKWDRMTHVYAVKLSLLLIRVAACELLLHLCYSLNCVSELADHTRPRPWFDITNLSSGAWDFPASAWPSWIKQGKGRLWLSVLCAHPRATQFPQFSLTAWCLGEGCSQSAVSDFSCCLWLFLSTAELQASLLELV